MGNLLAVKFPPAIILNMRLAVTFTTLLTLGALLLAACGGNDPATAIAPAATTAPTTPSETEATAIPPTTAPTPQPTSEPTATPAATEADLFLQLLEPDALEVITEEPRIRIVGRTRVDAIVTVNDTVADPDGEGVFSTEVALEDGPNIIEVIASIGSGEQTDLILVVIYIR